MALLDEIQAATRKYVHRQLHWFRADPLYRWLDACQPSAELAQQLLDEVARPSHRGTPATFSQCDVNRSYADVWGHTMVSSQPSRWDEVQRSIEIMLASCIYFATFDICQALGAAKVLHICGLMERFGAMCFVNRSVFINVTCSVPKLHHIWLPLLGFKGPTCVCNMASCLVL